MRIVFSRKGFDSGTGGVPSPILNDQLVWLPIPSRSEPIAYEDLTFKHHSLGKIVEDLTHRRIRRNRSVHLDPDLRHNACRRRRGWRPLFGQAGAEETHLRTHGVTVGDLFLFFGWFREVELHCGKYRYVKSAPDLHVIFGWLQVGCVISLPDSRFVQMPWADYHPHVRGSYGTIFVAGDNLKMGRQSYDIPGGGYFADYHDSLRLTAPGGSGRSVWQLPRWFYPKGNRSPLTYHPDRSLFRAKGNHTILRSVARGQEFILNVELYPEAFLWVRRLITTNAS